MTKTVDKGLQILAAFTVERPSLSLDDLAKSTEMPTSTLYRFLQGLLRSGYVAKDAATQQYRLGPAVLRLGRVAELGLDVRSAAIPWMDRLFAETGETIYLSVLFAWERLCVETRQQRQPGVVFSLRQGLTSPLYAGASGTVLLAFLPDAEVNAYLRAVRLDRLTSRTVTSRSQLRARLAEIRARGWDHTESQYLPDTWAVAAPVLDAHHRPAASLAIAGVLRPERKPPVADLARRLLEATRTISSKLGFSP
jgi:DNA-binding IclR family transcriptional regulator